MTTAVSHTTLTKGKLRIQIIYQYFAADLPNQALPLGHQSRLRRMAPLLPLSPIRRPPKLGPPRP